ncbi:MAG TPA: biotin/lipoyl-containing protein, partial [Streptosporangiaceae bacterium]
MSELRQFKLPDVGEGLTEADIVKWHVQVGETVKVNQIIVDIETAKAVVELPSPHAGVVSSLLVAEGATVDVGTPIISIEVGATSGEAGAPAAGPLPLQTSTAADLVPPPPPEAVTETGAEPGAPQAPQPERQAVLVGYGVKLGATTRRARKPGAGRGRSHPVPPGGANGSAGLATAAPAAPAQPGGASLAKP